MQRPIPEGTIDEIRSRCDLAAIVGEYLHLTKKGKNLVGLCPFHAEKTPSFSVSPDKQLYYCFGCGAAGNVFTFIMKMENLSFAEAARFLARRVGVSIPDTEAPPTAADKRRRNLLEANALAAAFYRYCLLRTAAGKTALRYLEQRGITLQTAEQFGLGYAPPEWDALLKAAVKKNFSPELMAEAGLVSRREGGGFYDRFRGRLIFPICDGRGRVIGFGGRLLEEGEQSGPKYLNSPETALFEKGSVLYGLHLARNEMRAGKAAVVMEGYTDVISAHQAGIKNAVASLGTALTFNQARLLRFQAETVFMAYDADAAGEAATWRGFKILADAGCLVKIVELPAGEDPDSIIRSRGPEAFRTLLDQALPLVAYQHKRLRERYDVGREEGRRLFLAEMLPLVAAMPSAVERDIFVGKLAKELAVSEEALRQEMKKQSRLTRGRGINNMPLMDQTNSIDKRQKFYPAERSLLALMLRGENIPSLVRSRLDAASFADPLIRRVVEVVYKAAEAGESVSAGGIIDYFSDHQVHTLITEAATDPSVQNLPPETLKRMAEDCIAKIEARELAVRWQQLEHSLREAEKKGLQDQARKILEEISELRRRQEHLLR